MSNPDKHKPLSPEELLKMLDEQSGKESSFPGTEMDDFEKEALEGFTAHVPSPEKAKALIEEVNISISKKAAGTEESSKKNKIIWFSAAASIALIVIIASVFFKQTKEELNSNIAFNEEKQKEATAVTVEPEKESQDTKPKENEPVDVLSGKDAGKKLADELTIKQTAPPPAEKVPELAFTSTNANAVSNEGKAMGEQVNAFGGVAQNVTTKDASKPKGYSKESDGSKTDNTAVNSPVVVMDKLDTKTADDESVREERLASKKEQKNEESEVTTINMSTADMDVALYKAKAAEDKYAADKKVTEKVAKEKAKAEKNNVSTGSTAPVSATTELATNSAYYTGGELAIRDFVINCFKKQKPSVVLKGKYKVNATVGINGTLKVNTIKNITADCNECIVPLTGALNTMKDWNAATQGGKAVSSETEFVLSF